MTLTLHTLSDAITTATLTVAALGWYLERRRTKRTMRRMANFIAAYTEAQNPLPPTPPRQ